MHPRLAAEQAARRARWTAARDALAAAERRLALTVGDVETAAAIALDGGTVVVTDELLAAEAALIEAECGVERLRRAKAGWARGAGLNVVA